MNICSKAIAFWEFQKQIEIEYQKVEFKRRNDEQIQLEKTYKDKMLESANQLNQLKHKLNAMRYKGSYLLMTDESEEMENDKKEIAELKEKYADTTRV